ncbi:MAG: GGDEF domain-containing protein, partial [Defluviitaleaceae bacterium]|nr:GGDEF domain-containing protein [Defluviitaleaceae bacterium]
MYLTKITSMTDKLTGALNRKYFEIAFEKSIQKAVKTDSQLSIIMTDLDNFKSINDTFGHQTGDAVLKNLGAVIRKNLRKDTIFGRFGGEEFIIVLEETNVDDAFKISEKLRIAVDDAKLLGIKRPVTASFGIATLPRHGISKAVLIDRADMALYRSKKAGRNISTIYDESQHSKEIAADTTDIISGDTIIDVMRMRMTFEIMNIAKEATTHAQKNSAILGRIKQMAQADDIFYLPILEVGSSDNIAKASVHEKRPKLQIE